MIIWQVVMIKLCQLIRSYVDLSDSYVDLSYNYVDLSDNHVDFLDQATWLCKANTIPILMHQMRISTT
jgi:hypothetical protein